LDEGRFPPATDFRLASVMMFFVYGRAKKFQLGAKAARYLDVAVAPAFAILGAVIVFAFGAARILQLRMVAGRARRMGPSSAPPAE